MRNLVRVPLGVLTATYPSVGPVGPMGYKVELYMTKIVVFQGVRAYSTQDPST